MRPELPVTDLIRQNHKQHNAYSVTRNYIFIYIYIYIYNIYIYIIYISLFSYIYKVQHNGYLQSRLKKYKNKMII